ncbi:uncharacterized protein LTR77_002074 [Saxophila tyrrhenica]|uniref:Ubiquitin-like-conjugating enzyme ATG10 n=1 Tax=Saxophila tyrrhenica TaxID=1690608 RepID=A0AAV9PM58_9PEZI|nr:hypothetical protein LTR77_002074 [Saxophila tyrrhenica]
MSISYQDFEEACEVLCKAWNNASGNGEEVMILQSCGLKHIHIAKPVDKKEDHREANEDEYGEDLERVVNEEDAEALIRTSHDKQGPTALYDIVHSPSYQVAVLYVQLRDHTKGIPNGMPSPDEMYDALVPAAYRAQLEAVGVMGALSMTEHPISGMPTYFIHPCRTAEAMNDLMKCKGAAKPAEYILLWLGLVGPSVGLTVPVDVAKLIRQES